MERELIDKFSKGFRVFVIVAILSITIILATMIGCWAIYLKKQGNILLAISVSLFFLGYFLVLLKNFLPLCKDYKLIQRNQFLKFDGEVIKFRKVVYGGEPETEHRMAIVKNTATGEEIELDVSGVDQGEVYEFLYLPNTKVAVCQKI